MATLCLFHKNYYNVAIITVFITQVVCYMVRAAEINGGFSAELIHKNSPDSPLYNHKRLKVNRRLMGPDTAESALIIEEGGAEHLMKMTIGTPPTEFYAIADTGSTLLWSQCKPCLGCFNMTREMFDPTKSSSYKNLTCADIECSFLGETMISNCSIATMKCRYFYPYVDKSYSMGILAKETVGLTSPSGKAVSLNDIIMGCGHNNTGPSTKNQMGIIGLGRGPLSFVSQISAKVGGKKFSHCLVPASADPKITSKISFGNGSEVTGEGTVTTPLVDKESSNTSYLVTVTGITIGKNFVPFNSTEKFLTKGNMLVDSGTPMTYLPRDFFNRFIAELNKTIDPNLATNLITDPKNVTTLFCINTMTIPKGDGMTVHLEGGGNLHLTQEHIFSYEKEDKLVCAAISHRNNGESADDSSIYGSILQTNFLVGYDVDNMVISFKPADCVKMSTSNGRSNLAPHPLTFFSTFLSSFLLIVFLSF